MTRYLIDTNVLIHAKNWHYGFEFCPAFWDWIDVSTAAGTVTSVQSVRDELTGGNDQLATWALRRPNLFPHPDQRVRAAHDEVSVWANGTDYDVSAIDTFLGEADAWLVANGLAHGSTVVTHERHSGSRLRIKIPNACDALGVHCLDPFTMLREVRPRFVLAA